MSDAPATDGPWKKYQAAPEGPWSKYQQRPKAAPAEPTIGDKIMSYVPDIGKMLGMPSALERSAQISAQQPYRPGMTAGQMMAGRPDTLSDPMLYAMGPGNIGGAAAAPTAARAAAAQRLSDFQGQGITPNVPAVGQGRAAGLLSNATRWLPYSPVTRGIGQNVEQTQQALGARAQEFGTPQDTYGAGAITGNALKRFAEDRTQAEADYGKFWNLMKGAKEAPIPNTLTVLSDLKKAYPNAPELTDVFTSSPILRMANALEPRQVQIPARTSPMLGPTGLPIVTAPARSVQRGGVLTMDELRNMRSQIGEKLEQPVLGPDSIPRAQLKRLYGALTDDMYAQAAQHSPAAARALTMANQAYKLRMGIIDRLDKLTNRNAPESIYRDLDRAASGQDAGLLNAVKKVLTPQEWGDVGASIIQRLGNPKPGVPIAPGEPAFSVGSLATNWRKMTPRAKELLFGPDTPGSPRAGLEQLSRVAASLQNVGKLANTSHTYENHAAFALIGELVGSLAAGRVPIPELGAYTGVYGVSKLLMNPSFTRWLYKLPNVIAGSPPMMASSLGLAALREAIGSQQRGSDEAPRRRGASLSFAPNQPAVRPPPTDRDLRPSVTQ